MTENLNDDNIDTVEEIYVEKINNTKDASFASLFNTPELSDILIVVNDRAEYHAHRLVLASRSEVFKAMLSAHWNVQAPDKKIHLHENPEAEEHFSDFLYYVYSGIVNLQLTNVAGLYTLADKYNIPCLRSSTMAYMSDHIATNSRANQAINWLLWAQECRNIDFEKKCFNFIINNFTVVANSVQWLDIDLVNLVSVLKSSDLVVSDECEVFEAVERWLLTGSGARESATADNLKAIIPFLRLAQMWPNQLVHLEQHSEIFAKYRRHIVTELLDAYRFQSMPLDMRLSLMPPSQIATAIIANSTTTSATPPTPPVNSSQSALSNNDTSTTSDSEGGEESGESSDEPIVLPVVPTHSGLPPAAFLFTDAKYKMRSYVSKNFSFALELKQEGDHYGPLTFSTAKSTSFLDQGTWHWNFKLYYSATTNGSSNKLKISTSDAYKQSFWGHGSSTNSNMTAGMGNSNTSQASSVKRCVQIAFLIGHKKRDGFYYKQYKYLHDFSECESFELGDFFKDWNLSACNSRIKLIIVIKPVTEI